MKHKLEGPMGHRIAALPHDKRGFPVPWFVAWQDGVPLFPVVDTRKLVLALRQDRCWVCGDKLGKFKCFVVGPMCAINRVSSEPPCHLDCALFAVRNCPFLTKPNMRRIVTQDGTYLDHETKPPAGIMIERNPGVAAIWTTTSFRVERYPDGVLMRLGPCDTLTFWAHGRKALRSEVIHSVDTGLPLLREMAGKQGREATAELERAITAFCDLLADFDWPERHMDQEARRYA